MENVLHLRDQKKQVIKKPVENSSSFYHSLEQTKISLKSNVVLPSNLSKRSINELKLRGSKLNFGGYVAKKEIQLHRLEEEEEGFIEEGTPGYIPTRSVSKLSNVELKRLEMEATRRIAKLQAEKYESRVKRRNKKGE